MGKCQGIGISVPSLLYFVLFLKSVLVLAHNPIYLNIKMGHQQIITVRSKVDLKVLTTNVYFTFLKSLEVEPHHQTV